MTYPAFAYTTTMQIILFFMSCLTTCLFFWFATTIILTVYGDNVSIRRRIAFVFFAGIVPNQFWTYGIFVLGGFSPFSPQIYALVTIPNPFFALLYYYIGVKTFQVCSYRSIRLMRHIYLYWMITKLLLQLVGQAFFAQPGGPYNYLLDVTALGVCAVINTIIYLILIARIRKSRYCIRLTDSAHPRALWYELTISFLQASAVYAFVIIMRNLLPVGLTYYVAVEIALVLFLHAMIFWHEKAILEVEMKNRDAYIRTLMSSIDRFDNIQQDFNQVLQAYDGYLSVDNLQGLKDCHEQMTGTTLMAGDELDLNRHLSQNPALVALLVKKFEQAKSNEVTLRMMIQCSLDEFYLRQKDLCRVLENLLDNAIAAAALSSFKRVSLSMEQKRDGSKLIVVSNSTKEAMEAGAIALTRFTTKESHLGLSLSEVRRIVGTYPQCSLQFSCYNQEFSVYIEILPKPPKKLFVHG